jgi:hypothetical protein
MKKQIYLLLYFLVGVNLLVYSQSKAEGDVYRLFFLGGQSNMDGYGYVNELPDSLNKTFADAWIFHGNSAADGEEGGGEGIWAPLEPGHGVNFTATSTENKLSDRFGIELSFVHTLQKRYPGDKIALIKYSRGGTSIDSLAASYFGSWEPDFRGENGVNQYDHFLATIRNALKIDDINGDGKKDVLIPNGILWMQGESDATVSEELALRYYGHLKRMMDLVRAALHEDDLPVVIGKISDSWNDEKDGKVWEYGELIQYAQEKFVREDENAAIVRSTRYYNYSDPWHYDSEGYIDLGKQFAEEFIQLNSK